jgi:isopenicillin-N epimerase
MDAFPPLEPPIAAPSPLPGSADGWLLDPAISYLNHGCFGARMRTTRDAATAWSERFEASPVHELDRRRDEHLAHAKARLGALLGMRPDDFGFVTNATGGVNAVLRSIEPRVARGDELLTTNHVYNAVRQTMRHVAARRGAVYRELPLAPPFGGPDEIEAAVLSSVGPRTRLLVIDHVTSPTALVLPVARIVAACRERGVEVLVDGAHAPGMLPLDVAAIGATYYTGNLHKWICAPVGAGFLWVTPDRQAEVHPNTISHFLGEGLAREFSWQATRDIGPWLVAPDAADALGVLGWERVRAHNHELAAWAQDLLAREWQVAPLSPLDGTMLGSMASLPVPPFAAGIAPDELTRRLYDRFGIEVPIFEWDGLALVRISCQVYNRPAQFQSLAAALREVAAVSGSLRS